VTDEPVRVGVVGAGPWASMVHAPVLAAGPGTTLAGVWARRADAASALAARHGVTAFDDLDGLFEACDAVAFAVPPDVQAELAVRAAAAGKALLLEKPIAGSLAGAARLAAAAAGVPTMVVLSWRYAAAVRAYLDDVHAAGAAIGGRGLFVSGALLGGPFATPWRLERGPLLDLGPHVLDLLDAAIGPITDVRATGDLLGWVALSCTHDSGAVSSASLCASSALQPHRAGIEVFTGDRVLEIDCVAAVDATAFGTMAAELATLVRSGRTHPTLGVDRGLHLQRLIDAAETQLRA
jgi:predicted dehydrogenase